MQLKVESASCVLVGILNKAILRPEWLVQNKIVDAASAHDEGVAEFMFGPGPSAIRFSLAGLRWTVSSSSLIVETGDQDSDPGQAMQRVVDTLSHTPVRALGSNFSWRPDEEAGAKIHELSRSPLSGKLQQQNSAFGLATTAFACPHEGGNLNLSFEVAGTAVVRIAANYHRDVSNAAQAVQAAACWADDRDQAEALAESIKEML